MRHLLHVRRVNHPGTDPALRVKRQQNLQSSVTAFVRGAGECARQGISPSVHSLYKEAVLQCIHYTRK